jgi:hypothetical protein
VCVGDAFCGASTAEEEASGGNRAEVAAVPTATAGPAGSVCVAQQAAGSAAAKGWLENFTFPALPPLRSGRQTPVGFE